MILDKRGRFCLTLTFVKVFINLIQVILVAPKVWEKHKNQSAKYHIDTQQNENIFVIFGIGHQS
jgi:hypothetical protein